MKVKMVDIARRLGISKATVSLAINGKPGVKEETRQQVLACMEQLKQEQEHFVPSSSQREQKESSTGQFQNEHIIGQFQEKQTTGQAQEQFLHTNHGTLSSQTLPTQFIKVVIINHRKQVVCDPELDLWSDVLRTFDVETRNHGYLYGLTYLNETEGNVNDIINECNLDIVAGVILFATEMIASDYEIIRQIDKPLVLYDCEIADSSKSCVCIDNTRAVEIAFHLLNPSSVDDICYFSMDKEIYNFTKRRQSFETILRQYGDISGKNKIVPLGSSIADITEKAISYFQTRKLPRMCILENYQISIGVLNAIAQLKISVPEQMKLVGIDEIPGYISPNLKLTQIRIPHSERAEMAVDLLDREIKNTERTKIKVFAVPTLIEGETV